MVLSSYVARFCAAAPLLGLLAASCQAAPVPETVGPTLKTITTPHGNVTGEISDYVTRYTVPYAAPPVGTLRLSVAREVGAWDSLDATQLPPACVQDAGDGSVKGAEDCLYMNVYVPGFARQGQRLPVMVWIHGGSFHQGDPSNLDEGIRSFVIHQHVVVVTLQYRLGLLGWLGAVNLPGNQGLTDVIQALKFIQSDLRSYGADPTRVTLAGQSSGAEIIKTLLVTNAADSLFHRAIIQSAPLDYPDQSFYTMRNISDKAVIDLGCVRRGFRCLREKSVQDLLDEQTTILNLALDGTWSSLTDFAFAEPFRIHIDGDLVTKDFRQVVASGQPLNVPSRPVIYSTVINEGCNGVQQVLPDPVPAAAWLPYASALLPRFFPRRTEDILDSGLYDPANLPEDQDAVRDELTQITTDFTWVCPAQQTALNQTATNGFSGNVYLAEFDVGVPYFGEGAGGCAGGVGHQDDIRAIFGPTAAPGYSAAQNTLTSDVQQRWASFVRSGNPNNVDDLISWPPVATSTGDLNVLVLGADAATGKSAIKKTQRDEICKLGTGLYSPR
ncbi:crystal protein [Rhodotorula diobovata]|uniref:Crystal protein n=1 Tax=Rhodotorula diobovata TaxID=5288 RepID=A0A5C5FYG3_9BASI|nr:crystal protein [Rhodotorula diobovata]